jgi:glucosamine 6-phosphate synthetase-like amidotransferase/phosphosugar isomerase protein
MSPRELAAANRIVITGCGTSLCAGHVGKYLFEEFAGIPTDVQQAAEFRYRNPIVEPGTCVIAISQSGETADTLAAVYEAQRKGATVLGSAVWSGRALPVKPVAASTCMPDRRSLSRRPSPSPPRLRRSP